MNWLTKKTKRRITFTWVDGTPDYMVVPSGMLGCIVSMLYADKRVFQIQVNLEHYVEFVEKHGGLVIPAAVAEYAALSGKNGRF